LSLTRWTLDRLLKPEERTTDHSASDLRQVYKHWLHTFERFITAFEAALNADEFETDKYDLLVISISSDVYAYVEGTTYNAP